MSTFATGSGDALAARTRTDLAVFTGWLSSNGVKGFVGEYGWPGSSQVATDPIPGSGTGAKFDIRWDAVAQQWYLDANAAGLFMTNWVTSEWNVDLRSYRTHDANNGAIDYRTTVSSVLEQNYSAVNNVLRGVNYAGGEFSDGGPNGALELSTTAQPGAGYYYPSASSWAVLYARGIRLVRLAYRWERVQTTLKGKLNGDIDTLVACVTAAGQAGIKVILDMHNYGKYDTAAAGNTGKSSSGVLDLGQSAPSSVGGTMTSAFVDHWSKMSQLFKGNAGLFGYGLTNEPNGLTGGADTWKEASRQACEAIRLNDQTGYLIVGGYFYSTIPGWVSQNGNSAWLTETIPSGQTNAGQARNKDPYLLFEGHHYWDNDHSGGYSQSYDQELSNAQNSGYTSYTNTGYTAPATNNTQQTGPRTIFNTSFDGTYDFSGKYDSLPTNSNTVVMPNSSLGNPGNSLKITWSATSDTAGARKSLTPAVFRNYTLDFYIPTGTTFSDVTSSVTISHLWQDNNSTDLIELRVKPTADGTGYTAGLTIPKDPYTYVNTGNTKLALGKWQTLSVVITDTAINLYVNGATSTEASISGSYSGVNSGGFHVGKFYGTQFSGVTTYFDNLVCSVTATYYAPPNGGYIGGNGGTTTTTVTTVTNSPITINAWYANGAPTSKTTTQAQTIARARYDKFVNYTFTQTGMPSGMPAGAYRVKAPDQSFEGDGDLNATVSEGIAYGMLATAFFGNSNLPSGIYDSTAKAKFDGLWTYYKYFKDANGLMNWHITSSGAVKGTGGASDADFDAAFALIIAHRQFGDTGAINYAQEATTLINAILQYEIIPISGYNYPNRYTNGDLWGTGSNPYYTDYFAPAWFREFYNHTGNSRWLDIITQGYNNSIGRFYNTGNTVSNTNGLITDLSYDLTATNGSKVFGYNSIRYPWRVTADYVWNGTNTNSLGYNMVNQLVSAQKSRYSSTVANQKAEPAYDYSSTGTYLNSGYVGAFGVGSIVSTTHAQWGSDSFDYINNDTGDSYFGNALSCMNTMLMAGIMQPGTVNNGTVTSSTTTTTPVTSKGLVLDI